MKCQRLLLLNLGTTSFKFQLYDFRNGEEVTASGMVERVGGDGFCRLRLPSGAAENLCRCRSCTEAFELCIRLMQEEGVLSSLEELDAAVIEAVASLDEPQAESKYQAIWEEIRSKLY